MKHLQLKTVAGVTIASLLSLLVPSMSMAVGLVLEGTLDPPILSAHISFPGDADYPSSSVDETIQVATTEFPIVGKHNPNHIVPQLIVTHTGSEPIETIFSTGIGYTKHTTLPSVDHWGNQKTENTDVNCVESLPFISSMAHIIHKECRLYFKFEVSADPSKK